MADAPRPWRTAGAGIVVRLRLTPGSSRDAVEGVEPVQGGAALKARVRARPENGKANIAAQKLLGKWLGVPQSAVTLKSGGASRLKCFEVAGDPRALSHKLDSLLSGAETREP